RENYFTDFVPLYSGGVTTNKYEQIRELENYSNDPNNISNVIKPNILSSALAIIYLNGVLREDVSEFFTSYILQDNYNVLQDNLTFQDKTTANLAVKISSQNVASGDTITKFAWFDQNENII